jgi:hypothetical protein
MSIPKAPAFSIDEYRRRLGVVNRRGDERRHAFPRSLFLERMRVGRRAAARSVAPPGRRGQPNQSWVADLPNVLE